MKRTKAQIKQAVDAFKNVTIKHQQLDTTLEMVIFMLELSPSIEIVNLVGPTGIGKSLLQSKLIERIHADHQADMLADPDHVPVIRTHALASGHKLFDWKSLYRLALQELGDPFALSRKAAPGTLQREVVPFRNAGESRTAAELRLRLELELRRRRTKYWIIDEAQHMAFGGRSGQPGDQFDVIKSIAQSTGVKLLQAGPQEMEDPLSSSGQLARRSSTVHFRRYQSKDSKSLAEFLAVANSLFAHMAIKGHPCVKENQRLLYAGSAGCVGILKDWLARAYACALGAQANKADVYLTLDHLRSARLSPKAMRTIMRDIRREEENMVELATDKDYEDIVFGKAKPKTPKQDDAIGKVTKADKSNRKADKSPRSVGKRNASRDPVPAGNLEEVSK